MAEKDKTPVRIVVKKRRATETPRGRLESGLRRFRDRHDGPLHRPWIVGQNKPLKEVIAEYFKDPGVFAEKIKAGGGGILPDAPPPRANPDQPPILKVTQDPAEEMRKLEERRRNWKRSWTTPLSTNSRTGGDYGYLRGLRIELVDNAQGCSSTWGAPG